MSERSIAGKQIQKFGIYLYEEEKSENTTEKYIRDVIFFAAWLKNRQVTKILTLEYKKKLCKKYAPSSVNAATITFPI